MQSLLHDGLLRESNIAGFDEKWRENSITPLPVARVNTTFKVRFSRFMGEDHFVGFLYGVVNLIVCVPSLVSYAHIVFTQPEFAVFMPYLVKLYFLSSSVMQAAMTWRSSIVFSIGQVQDVGLIFLAGMVRNIVAWARHDNMTSQEVLATSLWQCCTSTVVVGIFLVLVGRLQVSQYVQLLPLPVVGGYLGYIGYFCLAAGLAIGSGREINGPDTMVQLWDPELKVKLGQLAIMTVVMLFVHFRVKHFLGMPVVLLTLPVAFFVGTALMGISVEECRAAGWLPPPPKQAAAGFEAMHLFNPAEVRWWMLPRQFLNVCGLVIIVTFGSSLDIAAIQAEMAGQKIDYNLELVSLGCGNLASGLLGGSTGSYIFSQTIFSAKRGVKSRLNGIIVCIGEFLLFLLPIDVLHVLPNSYIGGIMCIFGIDIMRDWLVESRHLMAPFEYLLVWVSFGCTMWLTSIETFGVIEGMALGTVAASLVFVMQYTRARKNWEAVQVRSSVVRPPQERRVLTQAHKTIFAVSVDSFAFFGASLLMAQGIETEAERRGARYVCLDLGRLSGMDSTAADQMRLLVLSLERMGMQVTFSSLRSKTPQRLLEAHGVIGEGTSRLVFGTLDQALQHFEEVILEKSLSPSRKKSADEQPLGRLLLEYVDGFSSMQVAETHAEDAEALAAHFRRIKLAAGGRLFRQEDPADEIFVVAAGSVRISSHREWAANITSAFMPSPQPYNPTMTREISADSHDASPSGAGEVEDGLDAEHVGVGGILGDTAYFARRKCGCDAVAEAGGCVAFMITRKDVEALELSNPRLVVFLQKVLLRDLSQLQAQFLGPLQAAGGLS